ncbi:hypothetical protein M8494_21810 [Serratia ureilytica]
MGEATTSWSPKRITAMRAPSLIFDLRSSDVRYRQPLEYRHNGRDDARQNRDRTRKATMAMTEPPARPTSLLSFPPRREHEELATAC